jgi:signal transduction histidine kinase
MSGQIPSAIKQPGVLARWYQLTTPQASEEPLTWVAREKGRRSRLASTLLLIITIIWLVAIPVFFITLSSDPATLPITVVGLLAIGLLLFLNRKGQVAVVAWILIALMYLSVFLILHKQGSLDSTNVAVFDLLIYGELLAVSLLPALTVFPVALSNGAFILVAIFSLQPAANAFSQPAFVTNVVVEPLTLQLFVAVVTYLWVASTEREMARADQAELLAALERREAEARRQLAADSQHLLETLTAAARGDMMARARLSQDHTLWQVGMALNTLLARLQRAQQAESLAQQLSDEVAQAANAVHQAKMSAAPRWPTPTGGLLDPLLKELADLNLPNAASAPPPPPARPPWLAEDYSRSRTRARPPESEG